MLSHQCVPCHNVGDTRPWVGAHTGLSKQQLKLLAARLFSILSQWSRLPLPLTIAFSVPCFKAQLSPGGYTLSQALFR